MKNSQNPSKVSQAAKPRTFARKMGRSGDISRDMLVDVPVLDSFGVLARAAVLPLPLMTLDPQAFLPPPLHTRTHTHKRAVKGEGFILNTVSYMNFNEAI